MNTQEELFEKYYTIKQMTRAYRHKMRHEGGPFGDTTRGKGRVLALLQIKDGLSTKEIAGVMGIRVTSLNETLSKLENEGYIERVHSEEDKRVILTKLTEKGRAAEQPRHHMPELLFGDFDEKESEELKGYFDRMIARLETELGEDAASVMQKAAERRAEFFEEAERAGHGHGHGHGHGGHGRGHGRGCGHRGHAEHCHHEGHGHHGGHAGHHHHAHGCCRHYHHHECGPRDYCGGHHHGYGHCCGR